MLDREAAQPPSSSKQERYEPPRIQAKILRTRAGAVQFQGREHRLTPERAATSFALRYPDFDRRPNNRPIRASAQRDSASVKNAEYEMIMMAEKIGITIVTSIPR